MTSISTPRKIDRSVGSIHDPRNAMRRVFSTSRRLLLERSLAELKLQAIDSVLIVGAGHDPYRHLFPGATDYVCLDVEHVEGVTDVVGDAQQMPFPDQRFNCVFATECMEHVPDPFRFTAEVVRVLRPGGLAIVTVPFMFHQHGDPFDFWRPTTSSLQRLFSSCCDVKISALGNRIHTISDLLTTARPKSLFGWFRPLNHLLARLPGSICDASRGSTAPTGFLLVATR